MTFDELIDGIKTDRFGAGLKAANVEGLHYIVFGSENESAATFLSNASGITVEAILDFANNEEDDLFILEDPETGKTGKNRLIEFLKLNKRF